MATNTVYGLLGDIYSAITLTSRRVNMFLQTRSFSIQVFPGRECSKQLLTTASHNSSARMIQPHWISPSTLSTSLPTTVCQKLVFFILTGIALSVLALYGQK